MIYTLTLNPAVDLIVKTHDNCKIGFLNRAYEQFAVAGGKGINVSRSLNSLGTKSIAVGFVGGYTGSFIETKLKEEGIATDFVHLEKPTRINVKVLSDKLVKTEINAPSPNISRPDIVNIVKKFAKVKKDDVVIISGALPQDFPLNLFEDLLKLLSDKEVMFVTDMSGKQLLKALKYHPFLIKPNKYELKETLYINVDDIDDIINGAKRLVKMGAQNVVVSLGKDGAVFVNESMIIKLKPAEGTVVNTVGAGDSLIAGFVDEYLKTESYEKAAKKGIIVSAATAFSADIANEKQILEVAKKYK